MHELSSVTRLVSFTNQEFEARVIGDDMGDEVTAKDFTLEGRPFERLIYMFFGKNSM